MKNINKLHNKDSIELLNSWRTRFEALLHSKVRSLKTNLHTAWQDRCIYPMNTGGKRVRAQIIYAIGAAYGVDLKQLDAVAIAVEMLHTYTLIHDDLPPMDNDSFRRGYPATHKAFNEADAILIGDGLFADAIFVLSIEPSISPLVRLQLIEKLSLTAGSAQLVYGQWLDLYQNVSSFEDLCILHKKKTGALFSFCLEAVAILARKESDCALLEKIGKNLGLAFQIQDDLLDCKPRAVTGKSPGKDQLLGKKTVTTFMSIQEAEKLSQNLYQSVSEMIQMIFVQGQANTFMDLVDMIHQRQG